jgi:hypothetical protein
MDAADGPDRASGAWLRARLLRDVDGDGFPDTLVGPVWLASGGGPDDVDAAVASLAELLALLAERALQLDLEVRTYPSPRAGFFVGAGSPASAAADAGEVLHATEQARIEWLGTALAARAEGGSALYGAVTAWLDGAFAVPGELAPEPTCGREAGQPGAAVSFAASGGVGESLAVALRTALERERPAGRLVAPFERAAVRTALDPLLDPGTWQVRRSGPSATAHLEVVGHDTSALRSACRWYAAQYPRLPDGTHIDDLEDRLTRHVRARTRQGRVAAAAAALDAARSAGGQATRAELPYAPAAAPRWLGLPVRNSARDGAARTWALHCPWEGERLLEAAAGLAAGLRRTRTATLVEAFASERAAVRAVLARRLAASFEDADVAVDEVRVRHAYRPALHWLLEEVEQHLADTCRVLRVLVGRAPEAQGVPDRWLRELYPVAELIELRRPGVRVELDLAAEEPLPRYLATQLDAEGTAISSVSLAPLLTTSPLTSGGSALVTAGGVRVWSGADVLAEVVVPTDAAVFWSWFARDVVPSLLRDVDPTASPSFHEIVVTAALSEPDERLPLDHETDSVLEALHEDVYFGLLEAFDRALGADRPRHLSPGRMLPFFRGSEARATEARVTARAWGSQRVGVTTASGAFVAAPACDATVRLASLLGRGDDVVALELAVDRREALQRLESGARTCPEAFPAGIALYATVEGERQDRRPLVAPAALHGSLPGPLPRRPLRPHEVLRHAQALALRFASIRLSVPHESALGQPLPVLELGRPGGPAASRRRRAAWKPTVLLSCRQHANEASSTNAAFAWLGELLRDDELLRHVDLVVHPLENPDGARLHAALCALAPNHMHHAARYTAFGADLQTEPRIGGETIGEALLRRDAGSRWSPVLHLNNHGYPAHAWIRSQTGFVPRGFEDWSLPVGHLTIVISHGADLAAAAQARAQIADRVAQALQADDAIRERTRAQWARSRRYRPFARVPFTGVRDAPFWLSHRPHAAQSSGGPRLALEPLVTIITEVPDETVAGDAWDACVRAHRVVNDAVLRFVAAAHPAPNPDPTP